MPNNDQTISPNNRKPHRTQTIFLRHPDACIEQLYPTSGIVPTAKRTNDGTAARLSHRSALDDGNSVISRIHARQTVKLTGEWGIGTPTHIQQPQPNGHCLSHKPQAVSLIQFDTNPNKNPRIAAQRPDTWANIQTSGHVKRGDTPIYPDNSRNAFTHPQRPSRGVRQDKAHLKSVPLATPQPSPVTKFTLSQFMNNDVVHEHSVPGASQKSGRISFWADFALQERIKRVALREGLSISATCAAFMRKSLQEDIDLQYSATLEPILDRSIARHMRSIATRLSWLLVRIAFDCGQTRSLVTNILGRQQGMTQPLLKTILEGSGRSAKANIMRRTPQISELINSVEQWMLEENRGEKDKKPA